MDASSCPGVTGSRHLRRENWMCHTLSNPPSSQQDREGDLFGWRYHAKMIANSAPHGMHFMLLYRVGNLTELLQLTRLIRRVILAHAPGPAATTEL